MNDVQIWGTAQSLINSHGEYALREAGRCLADAADRGDVQETGAWKRVCLAVREWQKQIPDMDEEVH